MEIKVEMIIEVDDAMLEELISRDPGAKTAAPTAMRCAVQNALDKCLGDNIKVTFVSAFAK